MTSFRLDNNDLNRHAQTTPNGRFLVFSSPAKLRGTTKTKQASRPSTATTSRRANSSGSHTTRLGSRPLPDPNAMRS